MTKSTPKSTDNYKLFIIYGILFEMMTRMYKPFEAKLLQRLGGTDVHIAWMTSLPGAVMAFIVLPGAIYLNRLEDKQKMTGHLIMLCRSFLLLFAALPLLPEQFRPNLFVALVVLLSIPTSIYMTSYQSFVGDLFVPEKRANAIGKRNMLTVPAGVILSLLTGWTLKYLPSTDVERIHYYQLFYLAAFMIGMAELYVFKHFQVASHHSQTLKVKFDFKQFMSNRKFTRFLKSSLLFHFGWQMGWPLFTIYTISVLRADEAWLGYMNIGSSLSMFLGYIFWAKQIEKKGNHAITAICTLGMALTPLMYVLSPNLKVLLITSTVSGFFTSGTISVLLSDLLEVIPSKKRVLYIGLYSMFTNISLAISPLVGSFFKETFGIVVALMVTSLFRFIGSASFFIRSKAEHREAQSNA